MALSKKIQEIVDRNSFIRERVLGSISDLNDAQLNYKSADSDWSICDIVQHLALTAEANGKLMSNLLKRAREEDVPLDPSPEGSEIHAADEVFERIAEPRFQAPDRFVPHSHLPLDESLARLMASNARTLQAVEELGSYDLNRLTFPHPFAGDLNGYQWMLIAGGHEHRHGEQIKRMRALPDFPK